MNKFENVILKSKIQQHIQKSLLSENTTQKLITTINKELDSQTTNTIHIPGIEEQMIQHLIAQYDVLPDERKTWALYHIIRSLINIPEVERELRQKYDTPNEDSNYDVLIYHLNQYQRMIEQLKLDLDQLETKKDKTLTTPAYKRTVETLKNIHLVQEELYTLLYYLLSIVHIGKIPTSIINTHVQLRKEIQLDLERKDKPNPTNEGAKLP